jgi:hypothetical protein
VGPFFFSTSVSSLFWLIRYKLLNINNAFNRIK